MLSVCLAVFRQVARRLLGLLVGGLTAASLASGFSARLALLFGQHSWLPADAFGVDGTPSAVVLLHKAGVDELLELFHGASGVLEVELVEVAGIRRRVLRLHRDAFGVDDAEFDPQAHGGER